MDRKQLQLIDSRPSTAFLCIAKTSSTAEVLNFLAILSIQPADQQPATNYATYCVNSFCCGIYNCIPSTAMCCSNGQYCLEGTTCQIVDGQMTCQCISTNCGIDSTPSSSAASTSATATTTLVSQPTVLTISTPTLSQTSSPTSSPTSTSGGTNNKSGSGLSSGALAGIGSIAGIISCVVTVWGCIFWRKHRSS